MLVVVLMLMVLTARLASAETLTSRECTDPDEITVSQLDDREDDQLDQERDAIEDVEDHGNVIEEVVDRRDLDADRGYPFDEVVDPRDLDADRGFDEVGDPPDDDANQGYPLDEVGDPTEQGTNREDAFDVADPPDGNRDRAYPFDGIIDPPDGDADRGYPFDEVIDPPDQGTKRDDAFDVADHPRGEDAGSKDSAETRDDPFDVDAIDARVDDVDGERCHKVAEAVGLDDHGHAEVLAQREASVRRSRSWLGRLAGRVDLSLTWRRHLASSGDVHGLRHEVWLVGTWRL